MEERELIFQFIFGESGRRPYASIGARSAEAPYARSPLKRRVLGGAEVVVPQSPRLLVRWRFAEREEDVVAESCAGGERGGRRGVVGSVRI